MDDHPGGLQQRIESGAVGGDIDQPREWVGRHHQQRKEEQRDAGQHRAGPANEARGPSVNATQGNRAERGEQKTPEKE